MEDICIRCPHLAEIIFGYLDDKSLTKSRLVNKQWCEFIDSGRIIWIRILKKCIMIENNCEIDDKWKMTMKKSPHFVLKELAETYYNAYTEDPEGCIANNWNQFPFHFAASYGLFQACQHFLVHKFYLHRRCFGCQ